MTRKQLLSRVEHWRERVTPEWRVAIMPEPHPDERDGDSIAHTQSDLTISEIRVYFEPALLRFDAGEIDRVIVHELLHALLNRVLDHDDALEPHLSPALLDAYRCSRSPDEEEFIDRIARLIVGGPALYYTREVEQGHTGTTIERKAA